MNPLILAFLPGAFLGLAVAFFLLRAAPRSQRATDVLRRLDVDQRARLEAQRASVVSGRRSERIGSWLSAHASDVDAPARTRIPGFTTPKNVLDLLDMTESQFYYRKFTYALTGFLAPVLLSILVTPVLGFGAALPLILSPIFAIVFWLTPDAQVRRLAADRRREFTRFVTAYLELVAVALLGNTTPEAALTQASQVSDSWVFERIRREFEIADITRISKWQALERLGTTVGVPALVEMARMMRMSEAQVGVRKQLRAACRKLRAQVVNDEALKAQSATSRMQGPIVAMILPILALVLIPTALQFATLNQ